MAEHIADPLVHMIRNAVDRGLEPPEERHKAGKPQEGTIKLSAYHEGGSIVIGLSDDGRGLDRDAILTKARAQGLVGPKGLGPTRYLSGAAILADGRVGLIVNVEEIAGNIDERRQWTANESAVVAAS